MGVKKDVNSYRTKLLILIANELKNKNKCLMKLNSKDINDINTNFSINSFEVFMENPIEIGKPNHIGYKNGFENSFKIKKKFSEKIPSFNKLFNCENIKKTKTKTEKIYYHEEIILVRKKKITELKQTLGPKNQKTKKKHKKYNKKELMNKSIQYLRKLSETLKDSEGKNKDIIETKNSLKTERIKKDQFVHNILRDNIFLNNPYLIGNETYSPLIHYNNKNVYEEN